jgi:hypothetical protein
MRSLEKVCKFFRIVSVKTRGNLVHISGIDGIVMARYIKQIFETDRVNKVMFTSITDTSMTIHQFFIPDLVFILSKIRHHPKCGWSGKRTIDKIMEGILKNTWFKCTVEEHPSMVDPSRMKLLKWKPMPKQLEFLHAYGQLMPKYDLKGYILSFAAGGGKAQALTSLVRTPLGWSRMGDMRVNDKVVTPCGGHAKILSIHPQGVTETYRIYFEDGRWTDCSPDHLWKVFCYAWGRDGRGDPHRVISLEEILELIEKPSFKNRLYVPLIEPEVKEDIDLPIDPYVLGVILGDGGISHKTTNISKPDQWLKDELDRILYPKYRTSEWRPGEKAYSILRNISNDGTVVPHFKEYLKELGLWGKIHDTKFIPEIYMQASPRQRLALVQGLMDTDGTVGCHGQTQFCTTSTHLARQLQELIRSLGGLCKIKEKTPFFTYKGERRQGKLAYILNIRTRTPDDLFRLPRKKEKTPENYQYKDTLRLRIDSIEYIGKQKTQCIAIDHPDHLYITDDYIVTHNTFTDILVATCVIPPSIAEVKIIISPKKALHLVWEKTLKDVFHKRPTYWVCDSGLPMPIEKTEYYIFNYESLEKALDLADKLKTRGIRYFIIVDETHNFADPKSNRSQRLVKLQTLRDDTYFIWTSGTPILKKGSELISFLKAADKRFDSDAERIFKRIYDTSPGKAGEIFNHRLGQQMAFLVPKSEFMSEKPIVKELPVKLPKHLSDRFLMTTVREDMKEFIRERLKFYEKVIHDYRKTVDKWLDYHEKTLKTRAERKEFEGYKVIIKTIARNPDKMLTELMATAKNYERTKLFPSMPPTSRKEFRNALSAVKNIKLKVRGEALGTVLSRRRSECAAALGIYCKPDVIMKESLSKTIFFAGSVYPILELEKFLKKKGFNPVMVYGGTNSNLTNLIEEFTVNPELNPVCATMQSLSEAVPVTAASSVCFLNRPFRDSTLNQALSRSFRLNQKYQVTVYMISLDTGDEPNVSSTTDAILESVREDINILMGEEFLSYSDEDKYIIDVIDSSKEYDYLQKNESKIGLV